jgi:hypothetical protein
MTTTTNPKRSTIDEALSKFDLINSKGDGKQTACAMTLLSWVYDETWTDHPECAHSLIADAVIRANDDSGTTKEMRAELVRLGEEGVLDTWWIPSTVIAAGLSGKRGETVSTYDRAVGLLRYVAAWKLDKQKPDLRSADLRSADLSYADLSGADLRSADLSYADLSSADLSYADLSGADLRSADLSSTNLSYADLRSADLRGAIGNQYTVLPAGWVVNDAGLIVRAS